MSGSQSTFANADQTRAELSDLIDQQMSRLGLVAMDALGSIEGKSVLDVGCGTGQTLIQLADRVGPAGRVIGIEIAPRVLSLALGRTQDRAHISLVQGDASQPPLPDWSLDALYSRFGVMFFAHPVRAFSKLRRLLRPNGRVAFVCWRATGENEIDFAPLEAAGLTFEEPPHASLANATVIEKVLEEAGFHQITVRPLDVNVSCGGVEATLNVVTRVGALGKMLREAPELRQKAIPRVRAMLERRAVAGKVDLTASTWIVTATSERVEAC
ncbi:class I SAM-dependent methyltransferase [Jiella mangrovi]|uniref:Methyltransferase domain-containing protein n=1 Tax=Jiella mangrovi TaxID=2821407 RepID=A0ABS4BCD7_9HYPH|nr:class I SAM-dependent methyltransferase [Jiella mangrovi]MBP0614417.1 methyltransferase domain-containing protein [Jiella mangrovi]